jgi:hypothetical protein
VLQLHQLRHLVYGMSVESARGGRGGTLRPGFTYADAIQQQLFNLTRLQQLSHLELGLGAKEYQGEDLLLLAENLPRLRHLVTAVASPYEQLYVSCPKLCVRCRVDAP